MGYQKIKGTQDFYGENMQKMRIIENVIRNTANNYGFREIQTPVFENTEVFTRGVGDSTDIVNKEMYTFEDKGGRMITLRPEGTASVVRSFIENKMYANNLPQTKLFYFEPMFRYERPQTGRYREFHQFGVEVFGEGSPLLDVDVILSAYEVLESLKIENVKLRINSIGDFVSRQNYAQALKTYFSKHIDEMCDDCHKRLVTNPLRILDCKVDKNNQALINAPKIKDFLSDTSQQYFKNVLEILDATQIPYEVDENLVRGLDYYTDVVFEFIMVSNDEFNGLALGGGGRYADLVKKMGGVDIQGVGYAFGIERLIGVKDKQNTWPNLDLKTDIVMVSLDSLSKIEALKLSRTLRKEGFSVELDYKNINMKPQFKLADKFAPHFIIIIGEEERNLGIVTVKDTLLKTQIQIKQKDIVNYLKENKK